MNQFRRGSPIKLQWTTSHDGFHLTQGHHSNNCPANFYTDKIAWYDHQSKKGPAANWQGNYGGAEGDMLRTILEDVKASGFQVQQLIIGHDMSGGNSLLFSLKSFWQPHRQEFSLLSDENKISLLQGDEFVIICS